MKLFTNFKFEYEFKNAFLDLEDDELKYALKYKDKDNDNEFKIDENNCIISGTPIKPRTKNPNIFQKQLLGYGDSLILSIIAKDSMDYKVEDELEIKVNPSILYILSQIGKLITPIVGAIGLLKYRDELYAVIFKNKYQYRRREIAKVGKKYELQIATIKNDLG